jgi:predicted transport protein
VTLEPGDPGVKRECCCTGSYALIRPSCATNGRVVELYEYEIKVRLADGIGQPRVRNNTLWCAGNIEVAFLGWEEVVLPPRNQVVVVGVQVTVERSRVYQSFKIEIETVDVLVTERTRLVLGFPLIVGGSKSAPEKVCKVFCEVVVEGIPSAYAKQDLLAVVAASLHALFDSGAA